MLHQSDEERHGLGRRTRAVAADETPQHGRRFGIHHRCKVEQHAERHRAAAVVRQPTGVDMPGGVKTLLVRWLCPDARGVGQVLVDRARDHVEVQTLGAVRCIEHELRQALRRGIAQPFLHRQAVALGLADLLGMLVEEQLICEAFRRLAAEDAADASRQANGIDQVLAGHLVVDIERIPSHCPVGLPLELTTPTLHGSFVRLAAFRITPGDGACRRIASIHRHLHHAARARMDRQDRRVGCAALRPECRQDDCHHLVVAFQHTDQRGIEPAGGVIFGRRREFIGEPERVQEGPEPCVVMCAEAFMRSERIGDTCQRLAKVLRQQIAVRNVLRDLAQAIHVVAERDQTRWHAGERGERVPNPGCAGNFAKCPDMRQPRRAVAGLEQRLFLARRDEPSDHLGRFLERPDLGNVCRVVANCCSHPPEARNRRMPGQSQNINLSVGTAPLPDVTCCRRRNPHLRHPSGRLAWPSTRLAASAGGRCYKRCMPGS